MEKIHGNIRNLVFIKHKDSSKQYLFELPINIKLSTNDEVFCNTIYCLRELGTCTTDSFLVDSMATKQIINGVGAYEPLKQVIGMAAKRIEYEFKPLADLPF